MPGFLARVGNLIGNNPFYFAIGAVLVVFAAWSIYCAFNTKLLQAESGKALTGRGVMVLLFWALGPPIWFFLEYHLADVKDRPGIKNSSELAAQIWAAVLAILVFRLSLSSSSSSSSSADSSSSS